MPFLVIIALCTLAVVMLLVVWRMHAKRQLTKRQRAHYWKQWERVATMTDAHRRVLEAENIVARALHALGYKGSFAEKLIAAGPRFSQPQALWDAHKLRNRVAHEVGMNLSSQEAARAVSAFEKALKDLT